MKQVLILTYYWPPGSGPGVQRWLKFCKFLPKYGWEPTVITVENGSYPSRDETLLEDVPSEMKVIKTKTFEPFSIYNMLRGKSGSTVEVGMGNLQGKQSLFKRITNYIRANYFIPDARKGWNRFALKAAQNELENGTYDALITTGPPHSTHLVGQALQSQFGIKWIMDMRDPWTNIYYNKLLKRTAASIATDKALERKAVTSANALIAATPGIATEFETMASAMEFIPNGFDQADFDVSIQSSPFAGTMILRYVGNMKGAQDIPAFWSALKEVNDSLAPNQSIELHITGNLSDSVRESIENNGAGAFVRVQAFVPHKEAVKQMCSAHVLFLPIPQGPSSKDILTGKLFEYLASRRPIYSIGPTDGNAASMLRKCEQPDMIGYHDPRSMVERLLNMFEGFKSNELNGDQGNDFYKRFEREETTATLAKKLNELI